MKMSWKAVLIFAALATSPALAQDDSSYTSWDERSKKLRSFDDSCEPKDSYSVEMVGAATECYRKLLIHYDAMLNGMYQAGIPNMRGKEKEAQLYREAERGWVQDKDNECALLASWMHYSEYAPDWPQLYHVKCLLELTYLRVVEMKDHEPKGD